MNIYHEVNEINRIFPKITLSKRVLTMDADKFALVEKIIKDIDNVMSKNAELCVFDIVPVDTNFRNKSPVLHFENCLGLESWCVKHVYLYCYTELMNKYIPKQKRQNNKLTSLNSERLSTLLNVTLLLNPEISTFWNKRREMVNRCLLEKTSELQFTRLVLSRKAKCNDAFAYRRWLLESILRDTLQPNLIQILTNEELHVCKLASDKSPNNYHSWNHRMWLVNTLKALRIVYDLNSLYVKEYGFSERWASNHISDFSCFHYRQFCIKNIFTINDSNWKVFQSSTGTNLRKNFVEVLSLNSHKNVTEHASIENLCTYSEDDLIDLLFHYTSKACTCPVDNLLVCRKLDVLFHELVLNNELLRFYKYHETLWYHRRFVIHEIMLVLYEYFGISRQNGTLVKNSCRKCNLDDTRQKQAKIVKYDCNNVYTSVLFNVLLGHEKKIIEERSKDGDNYASRHEKYMKFVEGLNNFM